MKQTGRKIQTEKCDDQQSMHNNAGVEFLRLIACGVVNKLKLHKKSDQQDEIRGDSDGQI